ncbi:MAG: hypothetical protein ACEPO2_22475 [Pelagibaca sp.]
MNPGYAAAVIRFVIANKMKEQSIADGHGTLWRKLHGQTRKQLMKKKVVLSRSNMGTVPASGTWKEDAFVCFWVFMNKPITSKDIFIQEGSGIALTFLGAAVGSAASSGGFGTAMQQMSNIKSSADDISGFAGKVNSAVSGGSGIAAGFDTAWRAGMWDSVLGTSNEFAFAADEGLSFGCAAISGPLNKWTINMKLWDNKRSMISFMAHAETKGINTLAARQYIRELCDNGRVNWSYNTSAPSI